LENRSYGYGSVCVPGLAAGLWTAHQKWGEKPWAETVQPAITLARAGFRILPKSHEFFEESEKKLKRGDAEIARLYLPNGQLPVVGTLLPNEDLARTMELFARYGRDGFYRGPVGCALHPGAVGSVERDEARLEEQFSVTWHGHRAFGEAEVFRPELALGEFDDVDLAVGHEVLA
jgi:hypothetical protein